jgi:putative peptidoglycan lipid II flippase
MTAAEWKQQGLIAALTLAMAAVLWGLVLLLGPVFDPGYFFPAQALALLALCVAGAGLYFALAHITRVQPLGGLLRRLRRKKA